jgi:hypothetical protein
VQAQQEQAAAAAAAPATAAAENALQQARSQIAAYRAVGMDDEAIKQAMLVSVNMLAGSENKLMQRCGVLCPAC